MPGPAVNLDDSAVDLMSRYGLCRCKRAEVFPVLRGHQVNGKAVRRNLDGLADLGVRRSALEAVNRGEGQYHAT